MSADSELTCFSGFLMSFSLPLLDAKEVTPVIPYALPSLSIMHKCGYALPRNILTRKAMKPAVAKKPIIRIAVVESDPLRFVGFRALFDSEPDFELNSASLPEITAERNIDLVLPGSRGGQNLFDKMGSIKAARSDLKI